MRSAVKTLGRSSKDKNRKHSATISGSSSVPSGEHTFTKNYEIQTLSLKEAVKNQIQMTQIKQEEYKDLNSRFEIEVSTRKKTEEEVANLQNKLEILQNKVKGLELQHKTELKLLKLNLSSLRLKKEMGIPNMQTIRKIHEVNNPSPPVNHPKKSSLQKPRARKPNKKVTSLNTNNKPILSIPISSMNQQRVISPDIKQRRRLSPSINQQRRTPPIANKQRIPSPDMNKNNNDNQTTPQNTPSRLPQIKNIPVQVKSTPSVAVSRLPTAPKKYPNYRPQVPPRRKSANTINSIQVQGRSTN